ncbi:MAG TPA: PAAR domain-containing protein [Myxococcales bacterium]|nr:PAAR domain-containing protein [Myxococcales bacterium]
MPAAARLGDKAQVDQDAHGCPACPHPGVGPIVAASTNVLVNDRGAARQDDIGIHAACCGPNTFKVAKGSPTVYVNGKPFARMNDKTQHCGGSGPIIEGSPDVFIDDGADAEGLGSYIINAIKILLEQATQAAKKEAEKGSDTHEAAAAEKGKQDLAKDQAKDEKAPSISAARWSLQRALNGQEVELQIECKNPKGSLKVEIWAQSADPSQDKPVKKLDVQAGANVKQKVKLEIPADAAGSNECHFYFVVKDESGGSRKSDALFVDRGPFKFSI